MNITARYLTHQTPLENDWLKMKEKVIAILCAVFGRTNKAPEIHTIPCFLLKCGISEPPVDVSNS